MQDPNYYARQPEPSQPIDEIRKVIQAARIRPDAALLGGLAAGMTVKSAIPQQQQAQEQWQLQQQQVQQQQQQQQQQGRGQQQTQASLANDLYMDTELMGGDEGVSVPDHSDAYM